MKTTLIDGGYLSWSYGVSPERHEYWKNNSSMYHWNTTGHLFLMDGVSEGHRIQFEPTYKLRRRVKRSEDPDWQQRTQSVIQFRVELLYPDENLRFMKIEGFEADDLIALLAHCNPGPEPLRVVGVDKDLLQLGPLVDVRRLDGTRVSIQDFCNRLPTGLGRYLKTPRQLLLTLAIFGDKSDGIPRLLAPRDMATLLGIYHHQKPFTRAYEIFGDAFIKNLYLTILPGPWCFNPVPSPEEVYNLMRAGKYPGDLKFASDVAEFVAAAIQVEAEVQYLAINSIGVTTEEDDW